MSKLKSLTLIPLIYCLLLTMSDSSNGQTADSNDPNDPNLALVQQARIQFTQCYNAWQQYLDEAGIRYSSLAEPYVTNKQFHDLLELGPVAVPWYIEAELSHAMHFAVQVVLRADWPDLAGYTEEQKMHEDMYNALRDWWKIAPKTASSEFGVRMNNFRAWIVQQPKAVDFAIVRATKKWEKLKEVGLLGVPSVIQRIKSGVADEYDYRLLTVWTTPIEYEKTGFPKAPAEKEAIPDTKKNREFWLAWWASNSWQFWWLGSSK